MKSITITAISIALGLILSTLVFNLIHYLMYWLLERPIEWMGIIAVYYDMIDYSSCVIRMDYFMRTLPLLGLLILHLIIFYAIADGFSSVLSRRFKNK